jgi:hypothetical protein
MDCIRAYISAASPDERRRVAQENPDVLADDIIRALEVAEQLLVDTQSSIDDAHHYYHSLLSALDLPPGQTPADRVPPCHPRGVFDIFFRELNKISGPIAQCPPVAAGAAVPQWYHQEEIVYCIFGFIDVEEVLSTMEDVCRGWRWMLCEAPRHNAFWVGGLYQQFKEELSGLIATDGAALLSEDWRTIAMIIVTDQHKTVECGVADFAESLL